MDENEIRHNIGIKLIISWMQEGEEHQEAFENSTVIRLGQTALGGSWPMLRKIRLVRLIRKLIERSILTARIRELYQEGCRLLSEMERRTGGEDDVVYEKETAFLLSAFDGDKLKYKLSVPRNGAQYDVYTNGSYNGAKIRWDNHGKHVWSIPSLGQMYTHRAGGYYFNVGDVKP